MPARSKDRTSFVVELVLGRVKSARHGHGAISRQSGELLEFGL